VRSIYNIRSLTGRLTKRTPDSLKPDPGLILRKIMSWYSANESAMLSGKLKTTLVEDYLV
jgi:hypothetical protein